MARKKLTEYKAKSLISKANYDGIQIKINTDFSSQINSLDKNRTYVIKVDEGVKKRMKNGLIFVDKKASEINECIEILKNKGFENFLVEAFSPHDLKNERYLMLELVREGIKLVYSDSGGINVEDKKSEVKQFIITLDADLSNISSEIKIEESFLKDLVDIFKNEYFAFLEINPLVIENGKTIPLDCALMVDDAAQFLVKNWSSSDFVREQNKTPEELEVLRLDSNTPASLKLQVLNTDGSIGMLLSSGGASIVIADEFQSFGLEKELINYGEYSGGPTREETYQYATQILKLLLKSKSKKKVLVIAGGVANFTDIFQTFKGIIDALIEVSSEMQKQEIKVFVRRGGPNENKGLNAMKEFLTQNNLFGSVHGSTDPITVITKEVSDFLESKR